MEYNLGFAHFLAGTDGVARIVLGLMLVMSVGTWYLIVTKGVQSFLSQKRSRDFLAAFWHAPNLDDVTGRFVRRQDRVATVFSRGGENATPGFATADIGATWRYAKSQSLRIGVKNLFDREYHEHLTEGVSGQEFHMPGRCLVLAWQGGF